MSSKFNPVYVKVFGDALLPLLGYFVWDWSVYFILLFYILDTFVGEVLVHLKTKKIKSYSEKVVVLSWIQYALFSFLLLTVGLVGMHLSMKLIEPTLDFWKEIYLFLSYEEIGIAQGYVLLPLIVFMGYAQYRNEFIFPKKFQTVPFQYLWRTHIVSRLAICILVIALSSVAYLFQPASWFYIIAIVVATSIYQLLIDQRN